MIRWWRWLLWQGYLRDRRRFSRHALFPTRPLGFDEWQTWRANLREWKRQR